MYVCTLHYEDLHSSNFDIVLIGSIAHEYVDYVAYSFIYLASMYVGTLHYEDLHSSNLILFLLVRLLMNMLIMLHIHLYTLPVCT